MTSDPQSYGQALADVLTAHAGRIALEDAAGISAGHLVGIINCAPPADRLPMLERLISEVRALVRESLS
jgi:hypothetical protein